VKGLELDRAAVLAALADAQWLGFRAAATLG